MSVGKGYLQRVTFVGIAEAFGIQGVPETYRDVRNLDIVHTRSRDVQQLPKPLFFTYCTLCGCLPKILF